MQDKNLTCRDCGREFAFTASEQEFYAQRGFTNEPGRCPDCRAARKASQGGGARSSSGGYNARSDREMFPATCAECGKQTQVPFQPRTDRPVYCSDCYARQRPARSSGGYSSSRGNSRW